MGNWRRVYILGSCQDVAALDEQLRCDDEYANFHCLCYLSQPSVCGLGNWAAKSIKAIGNLTERGYSVENVASQLKLLAKAVLSLDIKVHCGADWEADECIATICVCQGEVKVGAPEIEALPVIPESQMKANLLRAMSRR